MRIWCYFAWCCFPHFLCLQYIRLPAAPQAAKAAVYIGFDIFCGRCFTICGMWYIIFRRNHCDVRRLCKVWVRDERMVRIMAFVRNAAVSLQKAAPSARYTSTPVAQAAAPVQQPAQPEQAPGRARAATRGAAGARAAAGLPAARLSAADAAAYNPADHTAEFAADDISKNKVTAMAAYMLGIIGIVIALLAAPESPVCELPFPSGAEAGDREPAHSAGDDRFDLDLSSRSSARSPCSRLWLSA